MRRQVNISIKPQSAFELVPPGMSGAGTVQSVPDFGGDLEDYNPVVPDNHRRRRVFLPYNILGLHLHPTIDPATNDGKPWHAGWRLEWARRGKEEEAADADAHQPRFYLDDEHRIGGLAMLEPTRVGGRVVWAYGGRPVDVPPYVWEQPFHPLSIFDQPREESVIAKFYRIPSPVLVRLITCRYRC